MGFSKAGAYLEVREPMRGYIKFKEVTSGQTRDLCVKCKEQTSNENERANSDSKNCDDSEFIDFEVFVTGDYVRECSFAEAFLKEIGKDSLEAIEDDSAYKVSDLVSAALPRLTLVYFMGDIAFGSTLE